MAAAAIRIDQPGHPTQVVGQPDRSRDDLELGLVQLRNVDDTGVRAWQWSMLDRPDSSSAAISNPTSPNPEFTADVVGSYFVQLIINEGRAGEVSKRLAIVRDANGLRVPAVREQNEANYPIAGGRYNDEGYYPDLRALLEVARGLAGGGAGGVDVDDGTTLVAGATTIELDPAFFAVNEPVAGTAGITMSDGLATSVFGVPGSAGAREDIPAASDDTFLGRRAGVVGFYTLEGAVIDQTYIDIDVSAEPDTALANGALSIGGLSFTVDDAALAGAGSGLIEGVGLSLRSPTSSANTWTVAAQNAPHLYLPCTSIPGFVPGVHTLIIDMHLGAATVFENGNDAVRMGFWGLANTPFTGAAARARIADRGNHGGVQTLRTFDGTNVASTAVDVSSFNAYSVIIPPAGDMLLGVGTYSGGWPARFTYYWRFASVLTTDSVLAGDTLRFLLAFINASDASPTSRADVEHLRFRKAA